MDRLKDLLERIESVDSTYEEKCWQYWDTLCKPLRGMGRLEAWVAQLGGIQRTVMPRAKRKAVVVMGADNGVVAEGVSQTGSEVTRQVLENMGDMRSSVCIMSRCVGADVFPVNIGMNEDASHPRVRNISIRKGTGNIMREPAMSREECIRAVLTGASVIEELAAEGYDLFVTGEMGIGNTTTSAACASVLFDADPEIVTGKGAGLTSAGLLHKIDVVRQAIAVNQPDRADVIDILSKVGGLDIAGLTGCFLGAAACKKAVLIDGVISGIAACLAASYCPDAAGYMIATHATREPAGEMIMDYLHKEPVLFADMHLGEGTGAVAALPLLDQALAVYYGMPSFAEGNVEQYTHLK